MRDLLFGSNEVKLEPLTRLVSPPATLSTFNGRTLPEGRG